MLNSNLIRIASPVGESIADAVSQAYIQGLHDSVIYVLHYHENYLKTDKPMVAIVLEALSKDMLVQVSLASDKHEQIKKRRAARAAGKSKPTEPDKRRVVRKS